MALSCVLGKFSHTVVPRAVRAIASPTFRAPFISQKYFSTDDQIKQNPRDCNPAQGLGPEIKSAQHLESGDKIIPGVPANFPFFKINGKRHIRLKRRLAVGENAEKFYVQVKDKRVSRDDFHLTVSSAKRLVEEGLHQQFSFHVLFCSSCDSSSDCPCPPNCGGMVVGRMRLDETRFPQHEKKSYGVYDLNCHSDLQVVLMEFIKARGVDLSIGEFMYNCCHRFDAAANIPRKPFHAPANIEHLNLVDQKLIRILDSEINSSTRSESEIQVPQLPPDFPFKVEDVPGDVEIKLTREFAGEKIVIYVLEACNTDYSDYPFYETPPDDNNNNETSDGNDDNQTSDDDSTSDDYYLTESSGDEEEDYGIPELQLHVKISKENGKTLEFILLARAGYIDDVDIDDDQEVDFSKSKKELDDDWVKYLEIRGIKHSIGGFLLDYMERKFKRDHLIFLRKLKKFVEYKCEEVEDIRAV